MTGCLPRAIAATYPPPVRRRWGTALVEEIARHGVAGRLDAVVGAARLWLRPGQWPAPTASHARRAVVVLAMLSAGVAALGTRGLLTTSSGPSWLSLVPLAVVTTGLGVLVPVPRATRPATAHTARAVVAPLVVPGVLLAAVALVAQLPDTHGTAHVLATALYWTALSSLALAPAFAVFRIDPAHAAVPGRARGTVGLAVLGAGLALTGLSAIALHDTPTARVFGLTELGLAVVTAACTVDLRRSR